MIATILSFVIIAVYTVAMCIVGGGIPRSLSATVFDLPPKYSWIWTASIGLTAFLVMPPFIESTSRGTQPLAFIACAALLFVAVTPLVKVKDDIAYHIHMTAAVVCAVSSQLSVAINQPLLLLGWLPWLVYFVYSLTDFEKWQTKAFWAEMTCFALTFAVPLIYYQERT